MEQIIDNSCTTQEENESIKKSENLKRIKRFKNLPIYEQKSIEWLNSRSNYLTASTIAAVLGIMGKAAKNNILIDKVSYGQNRNFEGSLATQWGNKYEPIANAVYSSRNNNIEIHEFGLITNEKYPILAVSPDGITEEKLLEIKCPSSRIIDGIVKKEYYHQIQEQLAVCEFDVCDFLECKFKEYEDNQFWDDFDESVLNFEKGIILLVINKEKMIPQYIYSHINLSNSKTELFDWYNYTLKNLITGPFFYIKTYYWKLEEYRCQEVVRDPNWIRDNYPIFEKFWMKNLKYRSIGIDKLMDKIKTKTIKKPKTTHIKQEFNRCML